METKICTYTEKNVRLQLLYVSDSSSDNFYYDVRFNRKILKRFNDYDAEYARLLFCFLIMEICIRRQSPLSVMTM